jgi:hypothetical protein
MKSFLLLLLAASFLLGGVSIADTSHVYVVPAKHKAQKHKAHKAGKHKTPKRSHKTV